MRVNHEETNCLPDIEGDLKLLRLSEFLDAREPGEDCYGELSRALQEALDVIQRSFVQ